MSVNNRKDILLLLDNLAAQSTEEVREFLKKNDINPFYFPPGTTDLLQPVDHHFAQQVKSHIAKLLENKLINDDIFFDQWLGLTDGCYPAWKCRILITQLVGQAWEDICKIRDMERIGHSTGCLMTKVGCAPPLIKIDGLSDYSFPAAVLTNDLVKEVTITTVVSETEDGSLVSDESQQKRNRDNESDSGDDDDDDDDDAEPDENENDDDDDSDDSDNSNNDKLDVVIDENVLLDIYADDTVDVRDWGTAIASKEPEGFKFADKPSKLPSLSTLLKRLVYWLVGVDAEGDCSWIKSEIAGGPTNSASAAGGVTMRIKCTKKLDKKTPLDIVDDQVEVAFNCDNYGIRWFLLETL